MECITCWGYLAPRFLVPYQLRACWEGSLAACNQLQNLSDLSAKKMPGFPNDAWNDAWCMSHIVTEERKMNRESGRSAKKHLFEVIKLCIDIAQRKETPGAIFCTNTTSPFQYSPRNEPNLCHLSQTSKHCKYICFAHRDKRERERERAKHRSLLLNIPHGLQSDSDVKVRVSFQNESDSSPLYTHPYADTSCHSFVRESPSMSYKSWTSPYLTCTLQWLKLIKLLHAALSGIETRLLAACSGSSAASASPHPLYARPSPCKQRAAKGVSKSSVSCSARSGEDCSKAKEHGTLDPPPDVMYLYEISGVLCVCQYICIYHI